MEVRTATYPIEILTSHYQIGGEFTPRGSPAAFVNDTQISSFEIFNATITPVRAGTRIGEMKADMVCVPRTQVQVLVVGNFPPAQAMLMPRAHRLVCFTDTYVLRCTFHVGTETRAADVFGLPGPLLPVTDIEIFSPFPMSVEIAGATDLAYIHKDAVQVYHEQD